ncbi:hypothetical protein GOP47_0016365 [Adiantum capillus-veneris]|uniref:protein-tyrosine-phosphatase n=1 Tax=Adiantum capillus-veneris TaxID=13818 RepID=A0A9D4ZC02_ADICA|nr:hypothetical protein GOP47_0016365 [Adiantum capillus-veneris]
MDRVSMKATLSLRQRAQEWEAVLSDSMAVDVFAYLLESPSPLPRPSSVSSCGKQWRAHVLLDLVKWVVCHRRPQPYHSSDIYSQHWTFQLHKCDSNSTSLQGRISRLSQGRFVGAFNIGEMMHDLRNFKSAAETALCAPPTGPHEQSQQAEMGTSLLYRCKKCRRIVACQDNVLTHEREGGHIPVRKKERSALGDETRAVNCTSVFVEPMQWMTAVQEGDVSGKLSCASCSARLGSFNWSGAQCSCGTWVVPAFQLHKSRMDASNC